MKLVLAILAVVVLAIGTLSWVFQSGLTRFDQEIVRQQEYAGLNKPINEERRDVDRFQRTAKPRVVRSLTQVATREVLPPIEVEVPESAVVVEPSDAHADGRLKLMTDMPEAMFEGTKVPLKLPNLEPLEMKQKLIVVPSDLTNLAIDKSVTASDALPVIGDLEYVTDGDKDAADGSYIELGSQIQWVQIDLEKPRELHAVWVWHFHRNPRAYIDVVVQVSNDETFTSDQTVTIYNADHDNSLGLGKGRDRAYVETNRGRVMAAGPTVARYVRLYSNGQSSNEMNHYIEVEVWGRSARH
ncbi:MAG: hypothetical protein GWQ08_05195 [Verrucomicrobiaceae bacterium]|nr:hypothetical protein [Verrucomicrobiaceae bacterium]